MSSNTTAILALIMSAITLVAGLVQEKRRRDFESKLAAENLGSATQLATNQRDFENQQNEKHRQFETTLKSQDQEAENRRFFVAIWDKVIQRLTHIDSENPIEVDVRQSADAIELICVCWEHNIIDKEMVVVVFGPLMIKIAADISNIRTELPSYKQNGRDFLRGFPAITRILPKIETAVTQRPSVKPHTSG